MDPNRFRDAYQRLQSLDERLVHRIRPRNQSRARATLEQVDDRTRDLAEMTIELKEILEELFLAIGTTPAKKD
ncbi:MAG TPA: hypothetical protein VNB06_05020 [Thermoanaerobaculia bacterium]|nr:hypothetical protein [Thermoanaerobaculia bacterium]